MGIAAIVRGDGTRNMTGTKLKIKANYYDNISTFVGLTAAPANEAERTTVTGTFVCSSPFVEYEFVPKTGEIQTKKVGAQFECSYEGNIFVAGDADGLTAEDQIAQLLNSRLVLVIPQMNEIQRIGGETYDRPAMMTEVTGGTKKSGDDGTVEMTVKFSWISANPMGSKFTGTAPLS